MPTDHCHRCNPNVPCGLGHLYVLELGLGIEELYALQPKKGFLYVGSTGKSVDQRFKDNLTLLDGKVVPINEARKLPEDGRWKYNSSSSKKIRKHYVRHRPDLLYFGINPIELNVKTDPKRLKRRETKLAKRLQNRGWRVLGDHITQ